MVNGENDYSWLLPMIIVSFYIIIGSLPRISVLQMLTNQCERYGGEELLTGQETINSLMQLQETWVEVGLQVFRRHPAPDGEPPKGQEAMKSLSLSVSELHQQMGTRINGESGEILEMEKQGCFDTKNASVYQILMK